MQNKRKIFNDPVYGFITIPNDIMFDIIEGELFQRLRRIKQLGLTSIVYPGANHTRFQHSLGAMHLMEMALNSIESKGYELGTEEREAALLAILLHDVGHAPFSHALEGVLTPGVTHEELSLAMMEELNRGYGGALDGAIRIFKKEHQQKFLCQLVSGQLDMDRMDYLRRDSFFTGVTEGIIGSDRIIKMLRVVQNELVVEAKGIYSIEKFLLARRLMYWQVYLHKTVIAADILLRNIFERVKEIGAYDGINPVLRYFLEDFKKQDLEKDASAVIAKYASLDDADVIVAIKMWSCTKDKVLAELSKRLLNRKLFHIGIQSQNVEKEEIARLELATERALQLPAGTGRYFVTSDILYNQVYKFGDSEKILVMHNNKPADISLVSDLPDLLWRSKAIEKYYISYIKELRE